MTKHHTPGWLVSQVWWLGAQIQGVGRAVLPLKEAREAAVGISPQLSSASLFSLPYMQVCLSVQISPLFTDPSHVRLGLTLMTSF